MKKLLSIPLLTIISLTSTAQSSSNPTSFLNEDELNLCHESENRRRAGAYQDPTYLRSDNIQKEFTPNPRAHKHIVDYLIQIKIDELDRRRAAQRAATEREATEAPVLDNTQTQGADETPATNDTQIQIPVEDAPLTEAPALITTTLEEDHNERRPHINAPFYSGDFEEIDNLVKTTHELIDFEDESHTEQGIQTQITLNGTLWDIKVMTHTSKGNAKRNFRPQFQELVREEGSFFKGCGNRNWHIRKKDENCYTYVLEQWHGPLRYRYGTMILSPAALAEQG